MDVKKPKHTQKDLDDRKQQVDALLPYRHVKLNTGEEFIAQVVMNVVLPDTLLVRFPFRVLTASEPEEGAGLFALVPMYPFTSQEVIPISKSVVVSIITIREEIQELYLSVRDEYLDEEDELGALSFSPIDQPEDEAEEGDEPKQPAKKPWVN
jgi:hypothetical protein